MGTSEKSGWSPLAGGVETSVELPAGAVLRRAVVAPLRALAFWAAVLLPLAYLPLVANGLTTGEASVLGALLVANVVALYVGHDHAR